LSQYNEKRWTPRLGEWVAELDHMPQGGIDSHAIRTRKALFGMGTIADIVISPRSGLTISENPEEIDKANEKLISLARSLAQVIDYGLSNKPDGTKD
jgi:hypothetical protein